MAIRYNKKLVIIMIMLILFSCTSCGVKQNTDKQEVKKKDNVGGGIIPMQILRIYFVWRKIIYFHMT